MGSKTVRSKEKKKDEQDRVEVGRKKERERKRKKNFQAFALLESIACHLHQMMCTPISKNAPSLLCIDHELCLPFTCAWDTLWYKLSFIHTSHT